jgi:hypothetical protein
MFLSLAAAPPIAGFSFKKSVRSLSTIFNFIFEGKFLVGLLKGAESDQAVCAQNYVYSGIPNH